MRLYCEDALYSHFRENNKKNCAYDEPENHTSELKSDGQEKSTKILISWQELKNQFLLLFVHR